MIHLALNVAAFLFLLAVGVFALVFTAFVLFLVYGVTRAVLAQRKERLEQHAQHL